MSIDKLRDHQLRPAHSARLHFHVNVEDGTTLEQVTNWSYWSNVAERIKIGTQIDIVSESLDLDVSLRVIGSRKVGDSDVRLTFRVLRDSYRDMPNEAADAAYAVAWAGPHARFRIMKGAA